MKEILAVMKTNHSKEEVESTNIIPFPQPENDWDPNDPAFTMAA